MSEDYGAMRRRKLAAVEVAETEGRVADSMAVRAELMRRVDTGELTLEQVQRELQRIQRGAKRAGKITRMQAYRSS